MRIELDRNEIPSHLLTFFERVPPIQPKNLMLIPHRFAIAMQEAGFYVRSDIIWAKKSSMPESVTDRPTSAHEHIFLFTKQAQYFFDAEAVRQHWADERNGATGAVALPYSIGSGRHDTLGGDGKRGLGVSPGRSGANLRNVWHLGPEPYPDAHFAVYPTEIPRRCILAGTGEAGCCPACGAAWRRVVRKSGGTIGRSWHNHENDALRGQRGGDDGNVADDGWKKGEYRVETLGWHPTCRCDAADPVPCTVLDPFLGAGTTAVVADRLGRDCVGIELSETYAAMAAARLERDRAERLFPDAKDPVATMRVQLSLFASLAADD